MNSYGAADAASRSARLSNVSTYRSESKMLYSADSGVRRKTPAFGRFTPLAGDGRSSPRTLKSLLPALERFLAKSAPTSRFASAWNFGISASV